MTIAYIINTCAGDRGVQKRGNMFRSGLYGERLRLLREHVLPATAGFDEVIVCGQFEEGEGYRYVPIEPIYRDRRDALFQRELGARYSTSDILVFGHDDHSVTLGFVQQLEDIEEEWDLLIPKRTHGITGAELNNGKADGYMGGHVLAMKRWLWAEVPWTAVDTEYWDKTMTRLWREAGARLVWSDDLVHIDVEAAEDEQ